MNVRVEYEQGVTIDAQIMTKIRMRLENDVPLTTRDPVYITTRSETLAMCAKILALRVEDGTFEDDISLRAFVTAVLGEPPKVT